MSQGKCLRCKKEVQVYGSRWCQDCYYPGIDETYDEYKAMLAEGHRPIQAAVQSGWQDPDEAGAAY
ncbi:hypothetical protein [Vibrio sp. SCSIO 43136]|uniref:hypothetical protein n=1 Tax=Vibrio sp. SCSIO 43136 TaxID=2819101 RepID=UPI002074F09E|nr:hypothetical protein [Vibrio sp. SCSIO 43136]USD64197.1 hypothetical protein J4N39_08745 [Vibrio sp. SCSIO 43136]